MNTTPDNSDPARFLSERFSYLIEGGRPKTVSGIGPFLWSIWKRGKAAEFISFVVWEITHAVGLFRYIKFTDITPIVPHPDWSNVGTFLPSKLSCRVSEHRCIYIIFVDIYTNKYIVYYDEPDTIYSFVGDIPPVSVKFASGITSVFVSNLGTVFISLNGGFIVRSTDRGKTFQKSLELSDKRSVVPFDQGITETNRNEVLVGEYGNIIENSKFRSVAFVYCSTDEGKSWERSDFLVKQGVNKHVHIIRYCKNINCIVLTDGDNKKQLWLGKLCDNGRGLTSIEWRLANKFHIQTGGYMSLSEYKENIIFGTDYMGGTNFIIKRCSRGRLTKLAMPDPYRRCPIVHMTNRSGAYGTEIWANIHGSVFEGTKSLLMVSYDGGESWSKLIEYDGSRYVVYIASASSTTPNEIFISVYELRPRGQVGLFTLRIQNS